uniref:Uncharacterized protein n=1 Tax=Amphimedon queenslandica TaxID=400682 RepID=A0A1X7SST3_AMPQE
MKAGLRIVDGSSGGRSALEEYKERRIGEAVFIDIDELSDQNNELPHMLPSANQFSHHVGKSVLTMSSPDPYLGKRSFASHHHLHDPP